MSAEEKPKQRTKNHIPGMDSRLVRDAAPLGLSPHRANNCGWCEKRIEDESKAVRETRLTGPAFAEEVWLYHLECDRRQRDD